MEEREKNGYVPVEAKIEYKNPTFTKEMRKRHGLFLLLKCLQCTFDIIEKAVG